MKVLVPVFVGVLILGTFGLSQDAFAFQIITLDNVKLDLGDNELKVKTALTGFTVTDLPDLQVSMALQNNVNGEGAFATGPVTTETSVDDELTSSIPTLMIEKAYLDRNWNELKLDVIVIGFSLSDLENFQFSVDLQNNVNGENAFATGYVTTGTPGDDNDEEHEDEQDDENEEEYDDVIPTPPVVPPNGF